LFESAEIGHGPAILAVGYPFPELLPEQVREGVFTTADTITIVEFGEQVKWFYEKGTDGTLSY
jgi:hypothetical protein